MWTLERINASPPGLKLNPWEYTSLSLPDVSNVLPKFLLKLAETLPLVPEIGVISPLVKGHWSNIVW